MRLVNELKGSTSDSIVIKKTSLWTPGSTKVHKGGFTISDIKAGVCIEPYGGNYVYIPKDISSDEMHYVRRLGFRPGSDSIGFNAYGLSELYTEAETGLFTPTLATPAELEILSTGKGWVFNTSSIKQEINATIKQVWFSKKTPELSYLAYFSTKPIRKHEEIIVKYRSWGNNLQWQLRPRMGHIYLVLPLSTLTPPGMQGCIVVCKNFNPEGGILTGYYGCASIASTPTPGSFVCHLMGITEFLVDEVKFKPLGDKYGATLKRNELVELHAHPRDLDVDMLRAAPFLVLYSSL